MLYGPMGRFLDVVSCNIKHYKKPLGLLLIYYSFVMRGRRVVGYQGDVEGRQELFGGLFSECGGRRLNICSIEQGPSVGGRGGGWIALF